MSTRPRILYVYSATYGVAGAYVAALCDALGRLAADVQVAVSAYYRFPTSGLAPNVRLLRHFFRRTENVAENPWHGSLRGRRRLAVRAAELVAGYARLLGVVVRQRVDVVHLSLTDDFVPTFLFAVAVRLLGRTLYVTAHDVVPHASARLPWRRRAIFRLAHVIVVHGAHVVELLERHAGVPASKVRVHTFPWLDVRPVLDAGRVSAARTALAARVPGDRLVVLAPGYIRRSKGFDLLVDEWLAALAGRADVWLLVAGEATADARAELGRLAGVPNVTVVSQRLGDEEMQAAMEASGVVVLPYREYAHSSVHLNAYLSGERPVLASDIPLFRADVPKGGGVLYPAGDAGALGRAVLALASGPSGDLASMGRIGRDAMAARLAQLPSELAAVYAPVLGAATTPRPAGTPVGALAERPRRGAPTIHSDS